MLLNFQRRFVAKILHKTKCHTIRAKRARPPRVGEICHCYTGLRRKGARLLGRWPCVKVQSIEIHWHPGFWIVIDGEKLSRDECEALARSDGFKTFTDMMRFWEDRLPFSGDIIHWDPTRPAKSPTKAGRGAKPKDPPEGVENKASGSSLSNP
jgi:hypothetical protein